MPKHQTYANHIRWYPLVHFVIQPLLIINLIYQSARLYQEPNWDMVFLVALSLIFILMVIAARLQALKAQDRLIRLEERLRYTRLLPPELAAQAMTMRTGTTIALRFASDDELEKLVTQVLNGELTTSKEIKRAITNWNGDYLRV